MMIFLELFYTFFKIGLFSFGGGYGMLSVIQGEVVVRQAWLSASEFTDIVAVSQMTPGPIGINSATYVGYTAVLNETGSEALAVIGSLVASSAVMLPSVVLMLVISMFFMKYSRHPRVNSMFKVMRPAVVGLIASAALLLMTEENFGSPFALPLQFWVSVALFVAAFVAIKFYKVNPVLILVLAGLFGGVFYGIVDVA
jgi:chromate transporter